MKDRAGKLGHSVALGKLEVAEFVDDGEDVEALEGLVGAAEEEDEGTDGKEGDRAGVRGVVSATRGWRMPGSMRMRAQRIQPAQ